MEFTDFGLFVILLTLLSPMITTCFVTLGIFQLARSVVFVGYRVMLMVVERVNLVGGVQNGEAGVGRGGKSVSEFVRGENLFWRGVDVVFGRVGRKEGAVDAGLGWEGVDVLPKYLLSFNNFKCNFISSLANRSRPCTLLLFPLV